MSMCCTVRARRVDPSKRWWSLPTERISTDGPSHVTCHGAVDSTARGASAPPFVQSKRDGNDGKDGTARLHVGFDILIAQ